MSKDLVQVNADKISGLQGVNYSAEELAIIKNTILKGSTDSELAHFALVASSVGLNPFNKEIWGYKDHKGNLIIFAGRDGFLKKAQESPSYNGIRSSEICAEDEYSIDIPNGVIQHKITQFGNKRGPIVGAYAIAFRKNGEPTVELAEFAAYARNSPTWKSHPAAMIKKVAETAALKKAFGIAGIQSEYDFTVDNNDVVTPVETITISDDVIRALQVCVTADEVDMVYEGFKNEVTDEVAFLKLLKAKKAELK